MKYLVITLLCIVLSNCKAQSVVKRVNGSNKIAYEVKGKGQALVFVHAGGLDKQMWQSQINYFSRFFKTIAYDIRGHGQTMSENEKLYEMDDLKALLDQENIKKVYLVGCSLGAIIALDFALAFPNYVKKLVLVSPGLVGFQEKNKEFLTEMTEYIKVIQKNDQAGMLKILKKLNAIGKTPRALNENIDKYVTQRLRKFIEQKNHLRIPKIKETNPLSRIKNVTTKVLVINGALDYGYIKQNAQKLNDGFGNSSLLEVKNAGHLINMEQPNKFNQTLLKFLRSK